MNARKLKKKLGNLIKKFMFRNEKLIAFFMAFTLSLFDSRVCLPFNKRNKLNLKEIKSQK